MADSDNPVQSLQKELDKLNNELTTLDLHHRDKKATARTMAKYFGQIENHHRLLNASYNTQKTEMWYAILDGNTVMAASAEEKLRALIEEQVQFERELPDKYKLWASMFKDREDYGEVVAELVTKITLKEEKMHTLKPCESWTCQHCKRLDVTALKKTKVAFKRGVAKMLKFKLT